MTWEQSSLSRPHHVLGMPSVHPPGAHPMGQRHLQSHSENLKGACSPSETSLGSGQGLVSLEALMKPQPSGPSSEPRPSSTSVPSSEWSRSSPHQHQQPVQHMAGQEIVMAQRTASRTSENFMEACAQLHRGFLLPRRGRGQGHMVDKQQHRGGRSHPAGSHLLDPRTPALVTPGSF